MTPAEIEAALRQEYVGGIPVHVGGQRVVLAPGSPEYESRIADMVAMELVAQAQAEAAAARLALRRKYRAAKTELAQPVTTANAVTRLTNTRTIIDGLLEILKDANLVLDDE